MCFILGLLLLPAAFCSDFSSYHGFADVQHQRPDCMYSILVCSLVLITILTIAAAAVFALSIFDFYPIQYVHDFLYGWIDPTENDCLSIVPGKRLYCEREDALVTILESEHYANLTLAMCEHIEASYAKYVPDSVFQHIASMYEPTTKTLVSQTNYTLREALNYQTAASVWAWNIHEYKGLPSHSMSNTMPVNCDVSRWIKAVVDSGIEGSAHLKEAILKEAKDVLPNFKSLFVNGVSLEDF
ncbi:uncharacterized protein NEMAJ01_0936 [Nematocida major]|uniref:uncharacterized protein n=1 Tax=Nematocida major TaxID=1912982 RepID=UPI0020082FCB|nr:uncharacterized protein NEMAJ01_0936 [Nematocida major]KAH9386040.1 hypothetical protein NEMAJ01_0936 [Nematocida major]